MLKVSRLALGACLLALAVAAAAEDAQPAPEVEREVFRLLNREREAAGLAAVAWDDKLAEAAHRHAAAMAAHRELSHQFDGELDLKHRIIPTGLRFDRLAENVALATTAPEIHESLMSSPPHRANILNPAYNAAGAGAIRLGGRLYVVEDFAHRLESYTSAQAEDAVGGALLKARGHPDLKRLDEPSLRDAACGMAERDSLTTPGLAAKLPHVRLLVRFTTPEPETLPESLAADAGNGSRSQFAVGGCFATSTTYPEGTYWFVVAFY